MLRQKQRQAFGVIFSLAKGELKFSLNQTGFAGQTELNLVKNTTAY